MTPDNEVPLQYRGKKPNPLNPWLILGFIIGIVVFIIETIRY